MPYWAISGRNRISDTAISTAATVANQTMVHARSPPIETAAAAAQAENERRHGMAQKGHPTDTAHHQRLAPPQPLGAQNGAEAEAE